MNKRSVKISVASLASLLVLFALITLGGSFDIPPEAAGARFVSDPRLANPAALPEVTVSIINTGDATTLEAFVVSGGSRFRPHRINHSAILVQHPNGGLLFDTGLGTQAKRQFSREMPPYLKPLMAYKNHNPVIYQLYEKGIGASDIKRIVLSHMHWDHASAIEDFPQAEVWTTFSELENARLIADEDSGFMPSQFDAPDIRWRYLQFPDAPYENFDRSIDLFEDGSVVLVPMFGHTPGSVAMFVNLKSGKRLLFTGDATWSLEGFTRPADKHWVSRKLVDKDAETAREPMIRVHQLMEKYPELVVVPAHDGQVQSTLGYFPETTLR